MSINVAIVGTGFMGGAHLDALRRIPGVDVVAIASHDRARADQLAKQFAIPHALDDWRALLDRSDVHAIHNCTPNNLHFEVNRAAMQAGKHVLSEKPLTMTSAESSELLRVARESGVVAGINFNYRGFPLVRHARALVKQGALGDLYIVHGHYIQDWLLHETDYNWRLESSVSGASRCVADIGSHWCDLVQYITGRKITAVFGHLFRVFERRKKPKSVVASFKGKEQNAPQEYEEIAIDTEDGGFVLLQFEGGMQGSLTVSQISAGRKNREWFEIDGAKSSLAWDQEEPNQLWMGHRDKPNEVLIKDPSLLDESARGYAHYPGGHPEGYPDGFRNLFGSFYKYIADGKKPGTDAADFPTFEDGHTEVKIVEAVLKSHAEQRWVTIQ
jgi:predicted dehydrogenase